MEREEVSFLTEFGRYYYYYLPTTLMIDFHICYFPLSGSENARERTGHDEKGVGERGERERRERGGERSRMEVERGDDERERGETRKEREGNGDDGGGEEKLNFRRAKEERENIPRKSKGGNVDAGDEKKIVVERQGGTRGKGGEVEAVEGERAEGEIVFKITENRNGEERELNDEERDRDERDPTGEVRKFWIF